jgi:hypothetical protein
MIFRIAYLSISKKMSSIQVFYNKLHSQEIQLDTIRLTHEALSQEWETIKYNYPIDHPLVKEIDQMFRSVDINFLCHSPIVSGKVVSDELKDDLRIVTSWLSVQQFKEIQEGFGSRAGVILHSQDKYIFNLSNKGYMSDFGGGVKAKHTPYYGLIKELTEECPEWVNYILSQIDTNPNVRIHCIETFYKYDEQRSKLRIRFSIIVFVPFQMNLLTKFKPTKEVKEIVKVDKSDLEHFINTNRVNSGLLHLQKVK